MNIPQTIFDSGLAGIYRGHSLHGDFPLLRLQGQLNLDVLLEKAAFRDAAHELGLLPELWSGETVRVETPHDGHFVLSAADASLDRLLRHHFGQVARRLQVDQPPQHEDDFAAWDEPEWLSDLHPVTDALPLVSPPSVPVRELSREERRDRARALRGMEVADPISAREDEWRRQEQERALLMSPGSSVGEDENAPDDDEIRLVTEQLRVMRAEGELPWERGHDPFD